MESTTYVINILSLKKIVTGNFAIDFSNILSKADLKKLAESDVMESVREVQEFYADYIPVGPSFFTLNIKGYAEGTNIKIKVLYLVFRDVFPRF
jgi:hypothetical protein